MSIFWFPSQVNERAARLVAGVVCGLALAALLFDLWWLAPILAAGFLLRVGWGPRYSPLGRTASWLAPRLWKPRPVSGPPKRFAQGIGALVTLAASALFLLGAAVPAWTLLAVIAAFAFLEAALAFCMGCWVYAQLQRLGVFPPDACSDCGPLPR